MIDQPGATIPEEPGQAAAPNGFVVARPLEAAAFAPFGAVIAHDGALGRTEMSMSFAATSAASPRMWVNRIAALASPIVAKTFEHHPFFAQNFLPLRGGRWLVIVTNSDPDGQPRSDQVQAFVTAPHQGVTYRPGVWHHGLVALDDDAEVVVVMCLTGRNDDTVVADLARQVSIGVSCLKH